MPSAQHCGSLGVQLSYSSQFSGIELGLGFLAKTSKELLFADASSSDLLPCLASAGPGGVAKSRRAKCMRGRFVTYFATKPLNPTALHPPRLDACSLIEPSAEVAASC